MDGNNHMDFKELITTTKYDFLRTNERLGNRIMLCLWDKLRRK